MLNLNVKKRIGDIILDITICTQSEIIGITGPSGSGKTTLLNCISGLVTPEDGYVKIDDTYIYKAKVLNVPAHKRNIAIVFQDNRLFPHLTVQGNLEFALKYSTSNNKHYTIPEIARLVEIDHLLKRRITNLSGGELKRVAIARAILSHPKLLLLDEPFTGMDDELSWRILHILQMVRCKLAIPMVLVSHAFAQLQGLCESLVVLNSGKIISQGPIVDSSLG